MELVHVNTVLPCPGSVKDIKTEVCTDVPCTLDKPRRITSPSEITCIDTRKDQLSLLSLSTPSDPYTGKVSPQTFISRPSSNYSKGLLQPLL